MEIQKRYDLTGKKFGRLTVVELVGRDRHRNLLWKCLCECGKQTQLIAMSLKSGHTVSCGCYRSDTQREKATTHGLSKEPEFRVWVMMKDRCSNPKASFYHLYGGRGIKVCERWLNSFEDFYKDMGPRPGPEYSVDRRRSCEDYEPNNCYWATPVEQARNRRTNKFVEYNGEMYVLAELAEIHGIKYDALKYRIACGMPADIAVPLLQRVEG